MSFANTSVLFAQDVAAPSGITHSRLSTRFSGAVRAFRSDRPLSEDQMRHVAPSIFAADKHASRSQRYTLYL